MLSEFLVNFDVDFVQTLAGQKSLGGPVVVDNLLYYSEIRVACHKASPEGVLGGGAKNFEFPR